MSDSVKPDTGYLSVFKKNTLLCVFTLSLYMMLLTISWDKVSIRFMASTFRLTQLFLLVCVMIWLIIKASNKSLKFRNSGLVEMWVCLFSLWCIGTDITSYNLKRSIMYSIWLVVNLLMIALIVDYVGTSRDRMKQMLRIYFCSFMLISMIAFLTFALEYFGFIALEVNPETGENIVRGQIRMFGLSYEPSYFATYLITCLTTISYLQLRGSKILRELNIKRWHFYVILVAFIGSVSRAGYVVFLPIVMIMFAYELAHARKYRNWLVHDWVSKASIVVAIFFCLATFTLVSESELAVRIDEYLFSGMGIGPHSVSAHSSGTRLIESATTLQTGLMKPWTGVGMGAFGAFFVDNIRQYPLREFWLANAIKDSFRRANKWHFMEIRAPEAMNVTFEVFASTGLPGLILWLIINFIIPFRLIMLSKNSVLDSGMRELLRAMAYGHIALFVILHMNQNFMRPYYWLHVAMCCSVYLVAKSSIVQKILT